MPVARLRWQDISMTEEGHRVYRSTEPIDTNNLPVPYALLGPNVQEFEDTSIELNTIYYYVVSSYKGDIEKFSPPTIVNTGLSPTGPGSDSFIGNSETTGFFGEVPTTELITGSDLASLIGLTTGIAQNDTDPWLKFFIDDKILFVAKRPQRHSISWDQINASNAVYGDREIDVLGYRFKIRLIQGINPDEVATNTSGYDLPITHQSEWNRLTYPIVAENATYPKTSQVGPNWVTYTEAQLGIGGSLNGRYSWCQETPSNSPTVRANRGRNAASDMGWGTSSTATSFFGWRPVLELVTT